MFSSSFLLETQPPHGLHLPSSFCTSSFFPVESLLRTRQAVIPTSMGSGSVTAHFAPALHFALLAFHGNEGGILVSACLTPRFISQFVQRSGEVGRYHYLTYLRVTPRSQLRKKIGLENLDHLMRFIYVKGNADSLYHMREKLAFWEEQPRVFNNILEHLEQLEMTPSVLTIKFEVLVAMEM